MVWGYHYITRDLPRMDRIEDYRPPAVSKVFSNDGTLIAEFYEERRYPAKLNEVPVYVRNAFLAAEDATFYHHPGIDLISIFRAFVKNIQTGSVRQGGSTITQQVVKNLLLTSEKKITRKLKEAILSYRLEQELSKDDIFEIYLNQIYFGNRAYGIKAAARLYFRKELSELTVAEGALLAGLPKAPSRYSPIANPKIAKRRQRYVLEQMVRAQFITKAAKEKAIREKLSVYKENLNNIYHAPYYVSAVRKMIQEQWKDLDIDREALEIHTAVDLYAQEKAAKALRKGLRDVSKRRGWRGPIDRIESVDSEEFLEKYNDQLEPRLKEDELYPALILDINRARSTVVLDLGYQKAELKLRAKAWYSKFRDENDRVRWIKPLQRLKAGDVILVSLKPAKKDNKKADSKDKVELQLDQHPELEGAMVVLDPNSGRVVALIGGYSYQRSQFNRAIDSYRQPGSSFKPVVYLAAVDGFKYTPATIVYDEPRTFRVGDDLWTPGNFDNDFLGGITLRSALEKSRNLVSADITSRIGVDAIIQYARKLGISAKLGRNLSISLGSSEVTVLEMTRAYGVFANKGVLFDSVFVNRLVDRDGKVIFDYEREKLSKAHQVVDEKSAFIMANMMKGVVQRGTGWRVRELGRPAAGKTGTSNDLMDAWFIGYTPNWVAGVWAGFDLKKTIGKNETGGKVSSPVWLDFMKDFLAYQDKKQYELLEAQAKEEAEQLGIEYVAPEPLEPLDFSVPDGVDPMWVDRFTGLPAEPSAENAIYEYFIKGTEPGEREVHEEATDYLSSPEL